MRGYGWIPGSLHRSLHRSTYCDCNKIRAVRVVRRLSNIGVEKHPIGANFFLRAALFFLYWFF